MATRLTVQKSGGFNLPDNVKSKTVTVGVRGRENAQKGLYNEYGTSRIPERPFVRTSARSIKKKIPSLIEFNDNKIEVKKIAEVAEKDMKRTIDRWSEPPNAPGTVRIKGKNDPLVDTGAMRNAVKAKIE